MRPFLAISFPATLAQSGGRAGAQEGVHENQGSFRYVDARLGSGSNSVAQSSSVETVQAAVNNANALNQQGIGVRVIVNAGEYKNYVNLGNDKNISTPLTLQAAVSGSTVVSEFRVLTDWFAAGGMYARGSNSATPACGVLAGRHSTSFVDFADLLAPTDPARLRNAASAGPPSTVQPPIYTQPPIYMDGRAQQTR